MLDPTCGSGTTATVAEQWGRRWITVDTSRVALALARVRIMGARYPYYLLADSPAGQRKEGEVRAIALVEAENQPIYPDKSARASGGIRRGKVRGGTGSSVTIGSATYSTLANVMFWLVNHLPQKR